MSDQSGFHKPPPIAGAVDLDALRNRRTDGEAIAQATGDLLVRQGLICPCGERIRREGVEYLALVQQLAPTPQGPKLSIALGATTFHSSSCPALLAHLALERTPENPEPICLRSAAPVAWFDEAETAAGG